MLVAKAEYSYYPEPIEKPKPIKQTKVKKKVINKRMYFTIAIISFITCLFILSGYAKITEARLEITKMEKEVVELKKIKANLEGDLESYKSTTKISEDAINNLGMIYPQEGQIIYISVEDSEMEVAKGGLTDIIKGVFK
ncbi:hypothetical protein E9840_09835 [Tissierella creatinini]|nr:hypothetical protein E9840_09835 [Tissierella creatinini]TJX64435.1 hypothetical protein E8P77_12325 [Soehngenia saccharolytica]